MNDDKISLDEQRKEQNKKIADLKKLMTHMDEFLENGVHVWHTFLGNHVPDEILYDDYLDAIKNLNIDKLEDAYSMAFYGFSPRMSQAFSSNVSGHVVNDSHIYSKIVRLGISENTENSDIFKYSINDDNWLLKKLLDVANETNPDKKDSMMLQLPDIIITPNDVKFSENVNKLLDEYNISVVRVGLTKTPNSICLGDIVSYDYENAEQIFNIHKRKKINKIDPKTGNIILDSVTGEPVVDEVITIKDDFLEALEQINTELAISKMNKLRKIQKRKIKLIVDSIGGKISANPSDFENSEAILDYILSEVEEMYKQYDTYTYNHIQSMKGLISALDIGFPDDNKLSDADKKDLERMVILHDVGKLTIPKPILDYSGKLTGYKSDIIQLHVSKDYANIFDINIQNFNDEMLNDLLILALNHHKGLKYSNFVAINNSNSAFENMEKNDAGYGDSTLANGADNELVKMLHVLDVYSALREKRSYKNEKTKGEIKGILKQKVDNFEVDEKYVDYLLHGAELEEQKKIS